MRIILELRADSRRPGRSRILTRPQIIGIFRHRRTVAFLNRRIFEIYFQALRHSDTWLIIPYI